MCIVTDPKIIKEIQKSVMKKPTKKAIKRNEFCLKILNKLREE